MNLACILAHKSGDDLTPDELEALWDEINEVTEDHGYRVDALGEAPQGAIALAHQIADDARRLSEMLYRTPGPDLVPLPEVIEILRMIGGADGEAAAVAMAAFCDRWGIDPEADLDIKPNEDQP